MILMTKKQQLIIWSYFLWLIIIAVFAASNPSRSVNLINHHIFLILVPAIFGLILYKLLK